MANNTELTADLNTSNIRTCGVQEKKQRKVVVAKYDASSIFVVPKNIDLESPEIDEWFVKWDRLIIYKKDGTKLEIDAHISATEDDLKRPMETSIGKAEDWVCLDEEDEE
jgi:hypothetical protein